MISNLLVLLVNLDSRADRLQNATEEAEKAGLEFTRISAKQPANEIPKYDLLTGPAKACLESHKLAYNFFLKSDYKYCLVLEDDFQVTQTSKLTEFLRMEGYDSFDLVQLGFLRMGIRHRLDLYALRFEILIFRSYIFLSKLIGGKKFEKRLRTSRLSSTPFGFIPDDFRSGAHAYVISRELAEELVNVNEPAILTIDSLLGILSWTHKFRIMRVKKSWITQSNSPSSITANRGKLWK